MTEILNGSVAKGYVAKEDAVINQANPVAGTPYTVLATRLNVRIISMALNVTWTVQPNPATIQVTIDGVVHTYRVANPVSGTWYFAQVTAAGAKTVQDLSAGDLINRAFMLEGRTVSIVAFTTGGTSNPLQVRVKYAQIP